MALSRRIAWLLSGTHLPTADVRRDQTYRLALLACAGTIAVGVAGGLAGVDPHVLDAAAALATASLGVAFRSIAARYAGRAGGEAAGTGGSPSCGPSLRCVPGGDPCTECMGAGGGGMTCSGGGRPCGSLFRGELGGDPRPSPSPSAARGANGGGGGCPYDTAA